LNNRRCRLATTHGSRAASTIGFHQAFGNLRRFGGFVGLPMPQDATKLCRRHDLTYVEAADLPLRRRRCGKGFAYFDGLGRTVRDKALKARIRKLAIPPAWTDVCIAEDDRAHIQAVGRDTDGRLQYRYHPEWDKARSETKARRLLRLGSALPRLRSAVRKGLSAPELTRTKVIAAVVRLIDGGQPEGVRKA
jgi:DNA topoisomerase IB